MLEKKLFLDPVILYQTKRFCFQDRKFILESGAIIRDGDRNEMPF